MAIVSLAHRLSERARRWHSRFNGIVPLRCLKRKSAYRATYIVTVEKVVAPGAMLPGGWAGEAGSMGSQARWEYVLKMRSRYAAASRGERSRLLDELVAVTG